MALRYGASLLLLACVLGAAGASAARDFEVNAIGCTAVKGEDAGAHCRCATPHCCPMWQLTTPGASVRCYLSLSVFCAQGRQLLSNGDDKHGEHDDRCMGKRCNDDEVNASSYSYSISVS